MIRDKVLEMFDVFVKSAYGDPIFQPALAVLESDSKPSSDVLYSNSGGTSPPVWCAPDKKRIANLTHHTLIMNTFLDSLCFIPTYVNWLLT
jgi:hypothetical protein